MLHLYKIFELFLAKHIKALINLCMTLCYFLKNFQKWAVERDKFLIIIVIALLLFSALCQKQSKNPKDHTPPNGNGKSRPNLWVCESPPSWKYWAHCFTRHSLGEISSDLSDKQRHTFKRPDDTWKVIRRIIINLESLKMPQMFAIIMLSYIIAFYANLIRVN